MSQVQRKRMAISSLILVVFFLVGIVAVMPACTTSSGSPSTADQGSVDDGNDNGQVNDNSDGSDDGGATDANSNDNGDASVNDNSEDDTTSNDNTSDGGTDPNDNVVDPSDDGDIPSDDDSTPQPDEGEQIGVMRSTDYGDTWEYLGHADIPNDSLTPVDPSPVIQDGELVLYFFDIRAMQSPDAGDLTMYRAVAQDSITFYEPTEAFSTSTMMITDPDVVQLDDGKTRMYLSEGNRVPSATSSDGIDYVEDSGYRSESGGVPGILALPDGRYRLYVCGAGGITSLISDDGLTFTEEDGVRVAQTDAGLICDPDPVLLDDGRYLMVYKYRPEGVEGPNQDIVYLAWSEDGVDWTTDSNAIVTGSVPGLVQLDDGSLLLYFVDFNNYGGQ